MIRSQPTSLCSWLAVNKIEDGPSGEAAVDQSVRGDGKGLPPSQSSREEGAKFSWRLGEGGLPGPVQETRARWCRYLNWGTGGRCGFGCWGSPGSDMNESRAGHCEPAEPPGAWVRRQPERWAPRGRQCPRDCSSCRGTPVTPPTGCPGGSRSCKGGAFREPVLLFTTKSAPPLCPAARCPFG